MATLGARGEQPGFRVTDRARPALTIVWEATDGGIPVGTFETLHLQVVWMSGFEDYRLDRTLGCVKRDDWELQGWTGIPGNEARTWGGMKALYR